MGILNSSKYREKAKKIPDWIRIPFSISFNVAQVRLASFDSNISSVFDLGFVGCDKSVFFVNIFDFEIFVLNWIFIDFGGFSTIGVDSSVGFKVASGVLGTAGTV